MIFANKVEVTLELEAALTLGVRWAGLAQREDVICPVRNIHAI
jgi:hypothetical protein